MIISLEMKMNLFFALVILMYRPTKAQRDLIDDVCDRLEKTQIELAEMKLLRNSLAEKLTVSLDFVDWCMCRDAGIKHGGDCIGIEICNKAQSVRSKINELSKEASK